MYRPERYGLDPRASIKRGRLSFRGRSAFAALWEDGASALFSVFIVSVLTVSLMDPRSLEERGLVVAILVVFVPFVMFNVVQWVRGYRLTKIPVERVVDTRLVSNKAINRLGWNIRWSGKRYLVAHPSKKVLGTAQDVTIIYGRDCVWFNSMNYPSWPGGTRSYFRYFCHKRNLKKYVAALGDEIAEAKFQ